MRKLISIIFNGMVVFGTGMSSAATQANENMDISGIYDLSLAELGSVEIITATGNSTPLDRSPSTASVINAAQIEAMGAQSLDEVLENIPGLHVSLSAISRLESVYSIRGIHNGFNPHVLLLMNGVPIQFSTQGGRPVSFRMPVQHIARVEVIRGPGSAIYGADAYSGVVNIITKDAAAIPSTQTGLRIGSFNSREFWLTGKANLSQANITFNMDYQASDGDNDRVIHQDLQTTLDDAFGTEVSLAPGALQTRFEILDTHIGFESERWQVNAWSWIMRDSGVGPGGAQALDYDGRDENTLYNLDATYRLDDAVDDWNFAVRASYLYYDTQAYFNLLPGGTTVPIGSDGNLNFVAPNGIVTFPEGLKGNPGGLTEDTQLEFISVYEGHAKHRWRFAAGYRQQSLDTNESKNFGPGVIDGTEGSVGGELTDVSDTPFVFIQDVNRDTQFFSLQDQWRFSADWELTAGVRIDDYSDFGTTTNPRLALVWMSSELLTTKFLYGSAFRAPSFSQQFNEHNPVVIGNESLEPETIDTYEVAFNFHLRSDFTSSLSFFHYQAKDLIEFVPNDDFVSNTAQNAHNQDGRGFEWEINWDATKNLRVNASFSLQDAEDSDTGETIADAPGQQFTVNAYWEFLPEWSLHGFANWVGDRERVEGDGRQAVENYTLVNMNLRRRDLVPGLNVALKVKNLFDENAYEPSDGTIAEDYPLEGRSLWLQFDYLFE
ncbi:Colicin I receptor [Thalassocella blandensis]|nr:Colicin I receptor [Thalassocella blandensis]